jgi:hypothetical protein
MNYDKEMTDPEVEFPDKKTFEKLYTQCMKKYDHSSFFTTSTQDYLSNVLSGKTIRCSTIDDHIRFTVGKYSKDDGIFSGSIFEVIYQMRVATCLRECTIDKYKYLFETKK